MENIEVLFSAKEIEVRLKSLAQEIVVAKLDNLLVVSILKGSFIFAADLIRAIHNEGGAPSEMEFLFLSSYKGEMRSTGTVEILRDIDTDVKGRNVLIIDDILESGRTLHFAKDLMKQRQAQAVHICVLLDKPVSRAKDVEVSFTGFQCPDVFVIGYGMDYAHKYRELPFVGVVKG